MISAARIDPNFVCIAVGGEVVMNVYTGAGLASTLAQLVRLPWAMWCAWTVRRTREVKR